MNEGDRAARPERATELKVFISTRDSSCDECGEELGRHAWITLVGDQGKAFCLSCADLDHLLAHLRHTETRYDDLLARGVPRHEARQRTRDAVDRALERWRRRAEARP